MRASQIRHLGLLLLLAGCSRDLALPEPSTLALADAFPSASPNERLSLQASGGAPPYRFAVLPGSGSKGPGGDPRVDAASGAYQAGSYGPAVDFVEVRDAGGSVVQARISVGPMLQVTPTEAFAAPGGRVGFVASGGKPPYTLAFTSAAPHPGTIEGTDLVVTAGGGCGGPVQQPATATLRLVDATGTAAPELSVNVGRGLDIYPAAGSGTVAPHEAIAFLASGGQPPYQFSMAANPSGGPGIDAGRGSYAAGATGQVTDRVQVADANGQVACADVAVGPGLSFEFSNTRAHPGQAMKVVASGGRPPYRFLHADKGNRSRGTLDAVTGDYVPGYNTGATDLITVSDATGTPPLPAKAMTVGGLVVDATYPDQGCHVGDVDGDGRADAVAVSSRGVVTAVSLRPGQAPRVVKTAIPFTFVYGTPAMGDVNRDGRADLAIISGIDGALEVDLGQGDGSFAVGALRVTDVVPRRVAMAGGSNRVFMVGITVGCGTGLAWYDYDASRGLLGAVGCVATGGSFSTFTSLVAGDWDGDGQVEVAYTRTTSPQVIAYRLAKEAFATEHQVTLPGTWRYENYALSFRPAIEVRRSGATSSDAVFVVFDGPRATAGTRTGLATLRGGAAGLTLQQVDRVDFGGLYNVLGLTALGLGPGSVPGLAVANGADGQVLAYDFPLAPGPLALSTWQPAARDFRVVGLCAGDLDGDGVEDLVLTPREQDTFTEVLLGEPDGGWDLRPRFYRLGGFVGDVDGDGVDDLVSTVQGLGLEVLFPSAGEFALGAATPVDGMLFAARAADWDGDGIPDLMARIGATGFSLLPGLGGGRFAPPQPVVVKSAGGLPYDPISVSFAAARLGGPGQGPDLITYVRAGATLNFAAIIFTDPTHATYGVSDMITGVDYTGIADLDGDGLDDLVAANGSTLRAALVRPGVAGPTWPFLPSVDLSPVGGTDWQTIAGVLAVPGAVPPRQRVVVVRGTSAVLVEAPGGALVATPLPVSFDWNLGVPVGVADVTGDGWPDLVAVDQATSPLDPVTGMPVGGDLVVFRGTSSGTFEATLDASLTLRLAGQVSGSILPNPAGPADLLMTAGSGYLVLQNDGLGHFR